MIKEYDDDVIMAKYGRYCAKHKAIRTAKEAIRDIAVSMGNATDAEGVSNLKAALNLHIDELIEHLLIEN